MNIGGIILRKTNRLTLLIGGLLLAASIATTPATLYAAQSSGAIAQGFPADMSKGDIVAGSLVSLKAGSRSVELATKDTADRLAGVADDSPLIAISDTTTQVQVVLSGTTTALVSDINGAIHAGDEITVSPIDGVGMKATADSRVVGTAQSNLDTSKAQTESVTDTSGTRHTVHIGYLPIQVGLAYYTAPGSNFLPPFLQNFANTVAGKEVSIIRIMFCTILLLFSFVSLAILISSTVRSAITSLGRNPLAAPNIRKSLYQVGAIAFATLSGTLLACYLILVL